MRISPIVVVPKPNGAIRLRLGMRRANETLKRETHSSKVRRQADVEI